MTGLIENVAQVKTHQLQEPCPRCIRLGTFTSVGTLKSGMEEKGLKIEPCASDLLDVRSISLSQALEDVELTVLTVADLGLAEGALLPQVYLAGQQRGLELCPAEVGPQLRLQYGWQPKNDWLLIAMPPLYNCSGLLCVFGVVNDERGKRLTLYRGSPSTFMDAAVKLVFLRGL